MSVRQPGRGVQGKWLQSLLPTQHHPEGQLAGQPACTSVRTHSVRHPAPSVAWPPAAGPPCAVPGRAHQRPGQRGGRQPGGHTAEAGAHGPHSGGWGHRLLGVRDGARALPPAFASPTCPWAPPPNPGLFPRRPSPSWPPSTSPAPPSPPCSTTSRCWRRAAQCTVGRGAGPWASSPAAATGGWVGAGTGTCAAGPPAAEHAGGPQRKMKQACCVWSNVQRKPADRDTGTEPGTYTQVGLHWLYCCCTRAWLRR